MVKSFIGSAKRLSTDPPYNEAVPKRVISSSNGIHVGARIAKRRREAGYSQRDLPAEVGISQRMIAYYETQAEPPPSYVRWRGEVRDEEIVQTWRTVHFRLYQTPQFCEQRVHSLSAGSQRYGCLCRRNIIGQ